MNSLRKVFFFFMAALLTAFALPALAHGDDEKFSLVIAPALPTVVAAPPTSVTATIKNLGYDDDRIKSFKITAPLGVQITTATVPGVLAANITIDPVNKAYVTVKNVSIKGPNSMTATLGTTFPAGASCGNNTYTWGAQAWEGTFGGESFSLDAGNSKRVTSISAACKYSLTGDSSVVAGSTGNSLTMTLTNKATAGVPAITAITLLPPPGITITGAGPGITIAADGKSVAFTGLSVGTTSLPLSLTVKSDTPSCTDTPAAAWQVSSIAPTNFVIDGAYPTTAITKQDCKLSLETAPTSAVKGAIFSQVVNLSGGLGNASVTLAATGASCPQLAGTLTQPATGGVATFSDLQFNSLGSCTLTATATNYTQATKAFDIFAASGLACNQDDFPTSVGPGYVPLDPNADQAYGGSTNENWGLRRGNNVNGGCGTSMNYTLAIINDPVTGKKATNLLVDKGSPPQNGNFKYVIVWAPQLYPTDGWPTLRPDVAWKVDESGNPLWIQGLACLGDELTDGAAVMPNIPPAIATADYPAGTPAKMCIAQVGWTPFPPVSSGLIQFWTKVIDQSDGFVKGPQ